MQKKNVGIFVNEMFHYREGIYRLLLNSDQHNFFIFTGNKKDTSLPIIEIPEIKFNLFGKTLWYQKGLRKLIKNYKLDIVIIQYTPYMLSSRFLTLFNDDRNYKIIAWTHGYFRGNKNGLKTKTLIRALKRVDGILFFSEDMVDFYRRKGFSEEKLFYTDNTLDTEKINTVKNKLPDKEVTILKKENNIKSRNVILFVGRIIKSKRLRILLEAMQILKDKKKEIPFLFIVGDGPERNKLFKEYSTLSQNDISWEGKITNEEKIAPYFVISDLFVMPGKTGLSINHAFAYGLPYLTTDDDIHAPEIILLEDGVNGEYFKGSNSNNLAKKINNILRSTGKLNKYSKNALRTIKNRYNVQNMYQRFIEMVEKI